MNQIQILTILYGDKIDKQAPYNNISSPGKCLYRKDNAIVTTDKIINYIYYTTCWQKVRDITIGRKPDIIYISQYLYDILKSHSLEHLIWCLNVPIITI